MKIQLSKTQWELIGKTAGWIKTAGGWGQISEESSDVLEAAVVIRHRQSMDPNQIATELKDEFAQILSDENVSDQDLKEFIQDTILLYGAR